jgi:hypothetical protein
VIPRSLIEIVVSEGGPTGEAGWRHADIYVGGEIEASGFAKQTESDGDWSPVEGEAIAKAWHLFVPKVHISGLSKGGA